MKQLGAIFLLLIIGILPASAQEKPQEMGLLLGLQTIETAPEPLPFYADAPDSMAAPVFRTLFLIPNDTSVRIDSVSGLFIPRPDTLWQVGIKRSVYNDWVEDFLWAGPVGQPPTYSGISTFNGEYCSGHRTQRLFFAGPRFLSFEQRSAGSCQGSAHPWFYHTLAVIPIDSTEHLGLPIDQVLGFAALDSFNAEADRFLAGLDAQRRMDFQSVPDPANWAIVRQNGEWVVEGRLGPISEAAQNASKDLFLEIDPFFLDAPAGLNLAQIASGRDSLRDAFASPNGEWLVLLYDTQLTIHEWNKDGVPGALLATIGLPPRTRAVSIRWLPKERLALIKQQAKSSN